MRPDVPRAALAGVRGMIDGIDDGLLLLLAGRRRLIAFAAALKRLAGQAARDPLREQDVRQRARRLGRRLGLPQASSDRLIAALIRDACVQQGLLAPPAALQDCAQVDLYQGDGPDRQRMLSLAMNHTDLPVPGFSWLRLLPPPVRLAPLLQWIPSAWQARLLEVAMQRVLAAPIADGALDALDGRRLGIEVYDLRLRWVIVLRDGRMQVCAPDETAEATVRGSATDLLLLASRREDADTLFFQRRLLLTGDTELGLTARNLLDQLPWQGVPLGLRIALNRGAGLAQTARAAHRGEPAPT